MTFDIRLPAIPLFRKILDTAQVIAIALAPLALGAVPGAAAPSGNSTSVIMHAGDDVAAIVAAAPAGSVFVLAPGLYRGVSIRPKDGDRFIGLQHGAVLTGARTVGGFAAEGGAWSAPFAGEPGAADLFIDNVPLRPAASAAAVTAGTYFIDGDGRRILVGSNPSGRSVEVGSTRDAFAGPAVDVRIGGLIIEKYAAPTQGGAIGGEDRPRRWTIEDCEIRFNHGAGIAMGDFSRAVHNVLHHNGQAGIAGTGRYLTIERNDIAENGIGGADAGAGAGGATVTQALHAVLRDNYVHGNHGPGLQTAGDEATLYEGNRVEDNDGAGIRHEMSQGATIRDNSLSGNGKASPPGGWGAQLLILNSASVDAYGNRVTVPDGGNGIVIIEQRREAGSREPLPARDNFVHDNEITLDGTRGRLAGLLTDDTGSRAAAADNHFDRDRYYAPAADGRYWSWPGAGDALTLDALRSATGEERDGTIDYAPAGSRSKE